MANLIETKQRLGSTKSTQKVIKAMELVASSKIKKAKEKAVNVDFYFNATLDAMNNLYSFKDVKKGLSKQLSGNKTVIIAITSDMGLCGAYNTNVLKQAIKLSKAQDSINIVLGSKGVAKFEFEKLQLDNKLTNLNDFSEMEMTNQVVNAVKGYINEGLVSDVKVVYTKYVNPLVQEVEVVDLFDLSLVVDNTKARATLNVEPEEDIVFEQLIDQYILSVVYSTILQSFASEHSYRRNSMEAANKNSLELIDNLNLEMNRIRQAVITQEISEIIGGSEALK